MRLLSCENPQRVFNKYLGEYVYVPCGHCNICRNKRAAKYTNLLERERLQHQFCFFVTLTYSDEHIPVLSTGRYDELNLHTNIDTNFFPSRSRDSFCIPFKDLFPKKEDGSHNWDFYDYQFFIKYLRSDRFKGLPYASKTDAQLFLKRLNKYAHDKITHQYKNFRYFLVSEYGSTTFRPHFHCIFYVDNARFADQFADCITSCWQYGINDTQLVDSTACGYVAQYINQFSDLPYVYQNKYLSPFFLCSRNPFIGAFSQLLEVDKAIVDNGYCETFVQRKVSDTQLSNVPLQQSYQDRLFPKCPCFSSVSDTLRTRFYRAYEQYGSRELKGFLNIIVFKIIRGVRSEFIDYLRERLTLNYTAGYKQIAQTYDAYKLLDEYSFNFLRRMYYVGRKVSRQACRFGLNTLVYISKIIKYYANRELYRLRKIYEFQENLSQYDADSCALLYPEYINKLGFAYGEYIDNVSSDVAKAQIVDAAYFAFSNKKTHFKNAYLDSLKTKDDGFLYNLITTFIYGKKCNEIIEALAT